MKILSTLQAIVIQYSFCIVSFDCLFLLCLPRCVQFFFWNRSQESNLHSWKNRFYKRGPDKTEILPTTIRTTMHLLGSEINLKWKWNRRFKAWGRMSFQINQAFLRFAPKNVIKPQRVFSLVAAFLAADRLTISVQRETSPYDPIFVQ